MSEAKQALDRYNSLLARMRSIRPESTEKSEDRLRLPDPRTMVSGKKTYWLNFMDFPTTLRRDPDEFLNYFRSQLAINASIENGRAIFMGRPDRQSFSALIQRYLKERVICPVCNSPDTHLEKTKQLTSIVCEACGARSAAK
ncbi:MAG TPA: translation initiation factor IF-2 [Nitrososphaerales archaeon]|nr:translation initiation factor IF-2 [Nitrososphaerales archaeon]